MTSTPGTVDQLIGPENGGTWQDAALAAAESPALASVGKQLPKLTGLLTNIAAARSVTGGIPALLRVDLGLILIGGWKKIEELQGYANPKKYGPDETFYVELTRHVVSSAHKPSLEVSVNGKVIETLPFELKVAVTLDGAVLTIRGGKIYGVAPGKCRGSLELKCEGYSVLKREPAPITLPLAWTFKEPVVIPPPKAA